jgi:hypothetical protein
MTSGNDPADTVPERAPVPERARVPELVEGSQREDSGPIDTKRSDPHEHAGHFILSIG